MVPESLAHVQEGMDIGLVTSCRQLGLVCCHKQVQTHQGSEYCEGPKRPLHESSGCQMGFVRSAVSSEIEKSTFAYAPLGLLKYTSCKHAPTQIFIGPTMCLKFLVYDMPGKLPFCSQQVVLNPRHRPCIACGLDGPSGPYTQPRTIRSLRC